ncbi:hypothetical protein ERUR111494_02395 [Erysipelothrix urinaevulpis]|nr:hypothetical protein [Erysipelothrix urinaevulpis]
MAKGVPYRTELLYILLFEQLIEGYSIIPLLSKNLLLELGV